MGDGAKKVARVCHKVMSQGYAAVAYQFVLTTTFTGVYCPQLLEFTVPIY